VTTDEGSSPRKAAAPSASGSDDRVSEGSPSSPEVPESVRVLEQFLQEDGWYPRKLSVENGHVFRVDFRGAHGLMPCYAEVRPEFSQFIFYVVAPVKADPSKMQEVCEFVARANYGLRIGNLELDFDDGEIRYKSSLDFEGTGLTPGLLKGAMYPAVQTMDDYLPGLLAVVFGGATAKAAIEAIENQ